MSSALNIQVDYDPTAVPHFIAVEGPIGVGKTTLAKNLAHTFGYPTLLEEASDNPFLPRFYEDPRTHALPTQLHFLFQRARQLQALRQDDMFAPVKIADYLMAKDQLFAQVTLDDDEYRLYQQVYEQLTINAPVPDIVVYLQAPIETLLARIRKRGIASERYIDEQYLRTLNEAYTKFFHHYTDSPLLIVNTAEINLVDNAEHYKQFVEYLLTIKSGRHYYNPVVL